MSSDVDFMEDITPSLTVGLLPIRPRKCTYSEYWYQLHGPLSRLRPGRKSTPDLQTWNFNPSPRE